MPDCKPVGSNRPTAKIAVRLCNIGLSRLPARYLGRPACAVHALSGPTRWGSVSLPLEAWPEISRVAGRDLTPSADQPMMTPPASALERLRRLHAAAIHLGEHAPEVIANPESARGLEQEMIQALVDTLGAPIAERGEVAHRHHVTIVRRFREALAKTVDKAIYMPEICAAIGASDRTLRKCCQEHFGMGPKRYLFLRRMHLANQALRKAAADQTSVTEVATEFGFWELGRFAVEYKTLFGESPSTTLRRHRNPVPLVGPIPAKTA